MVFHTNALVWNTIHHVLGVALPDTLQRLPGDHMNMPGLGVHGRRRPLGHLDDFINQLPGDGLGEIASDAGASFDE